MSLPKLPIGDRYRREVRTEWGGLNLNENAGDGELTEALNMSSREFPLLATARFSKERADRAMCLPYTYGGWLGYQYREGNDYLLYDHGHPGAANVVRHDAPGETQYAILGHRMCIFPAKQIYDFESGAMADLEASWSGSAVFGNGTDQGAAAEGCTIQAAGIGADFRAGDAVTISGCTVRPENNKTAVIREVAENELRFYENTFELGNSTRAYTAASAMPAGDYWFFALGAAYHFTLSPKPAGTRITYAPDYPRAGDQSVIIEAPGASAIGTLVTLGVSGTYLEFASVPAPHTETAITVRRALPDMDYVCVNENRVWGCRGDAVYSSKLGDPLNWNVFDGVATDSWTVETGTPGEFTGCASFQGYPVFFKENAVFKVLGDTPQNFVLRKINILGVYAGAFRSISEIRGRLYYLSQAGVMEWNGGDHPSIISGAIGLEPGQSVSNRACAGTDSVRYYLETAPYKYEREIGRWVQQPGIYVYDTRYGIWHRIQKKPGEAETMFVGDGTHNWMIKDWDEQDIPQVYPLHAFPALEDAATEWAVTFADSTRAYKTALAGSEGKKGVLRLLIRCRLEKTMKVQIAYDGGEFEEAGEFGGEDGMAKTSRVVPLILRRCDFWQLRLTGMGDAVIYSIAAERYGGEWQQA